MFLNPEKQEEVAEISTKKKNIAKNYFKKADMKRLYPKLFQILWESTLPCLAGKMTCFSSSLLNTLSFFRGGYGRSHARLLRGCRPEDQLLQLVHQGSHGLGHVLCSQLGEYLEEF